MKVIWSLVSRHCAKTRFYTIWSLVTNSMRKNVNLKYTRKTSKLKKLTGTSYSCMSLSANSLLEPKCYKIKRCRNVVLDSSDAPILYLLNTFLFLQKWYIVYHVSDSICIWEWMRLPYILKYNIQHKHMIFSSPANIFYEFNHLHRPQVFP